MDSNIQHAKKSHLLKTLIFVVTLTLTLNVYAQKQDKVQQAINAIKATNDNEDKDYITDGQRVVWVKSYKNWKPNDLRVMKKEAPDVLSFLSQAIQRNRYDVLEQLLPEYYRNHGGTKAFATDVMKQASSKVVNVKS